MYWFYSILHSESQRESQGKNRKWLKKAFAVFLF